MKKNLMGDGIDGAVHAAAGAQLLDVCKKIPCKDGKKDIQIEIGGAVLAGAFNITNFSSISYLVTHIGALLI